MQRETYLSPLREVKFSDDGAMSFAGYGAYFNNVDSYGDVIAPGAFAKTLKDANTSGNWPAMLLQHGNFLGGDDNMPVGVWTEMREDSKGLWVEGQLADTQRGRDAYALLKMSPRPAINGMSIGFRATEWTMRTKPDEPRRTLKAVELMEVSLVTFPANPKARVSQVKAATDFTAEEIRDIEATLRTKGLSRTDAAKAISGFKDWLQRDAGAPGTDPRDEGTADHLAALIRRNIATLTA
jgi:uncharacterized protein